MEYLRVMKKNVLRLFALIIMLSAGVYASGQDYEELRLKKWSADAPLTWDDFSVRHLPDGLLEYARIVTEEDGGYRSVRHNNIDIRCDVRDACMNRVLSWYDPDHCDEWTLRYLQVVFDIRQYEARVSGLKRSGFDVSGLEFGSWPSGWYSCLVDDYWEDRDSVVYSFEIESNYGRDTTVILEYEQRIRRALSDSLLTHFENYMDMIVPQGKGVHYVSFERCIGYSNESFFGPIGQGVGTLNGILLGYTVYVGRLMSSLKFSWMGNCQSDDRNIVLDVGCLLYDGYHVSVTPFAGIGQSLLKRHPDYSERTGAVRYEAGLLVDWNMVNDFRYNICGGVRLKTRFKVFGAMSDYKPFRESYSLNIGVQFVYSLFGYGSLRIR